MQQSFDLDTVYSVSQISLAIKSKLEFAFTNIKVSGETTDIKANFSSGHIYFSIKDQDSVLNCIIWSKTAKTLHYKPELGRFAEFSGYISSFEKSSRYNLIVTSVQEIGIGALQKEIEARKKRLAALGIFDLARKRPIATMPSVIAIITSKSGAVLHDICHRIANRFPIVKILVYHSAMQGYGAAQDVINGIIALNNHAEPIDTIIIARGGGSAEDLMEFNDESLAIAISNSKIPIISAIGHETDFTIADLASDLRAPTPTAAAELATPDRHAIAATITSIYKRCTIAGQRILDLHITKVSRLTRSIRYECSKRINQNKTHLLKQKHFILTSSTNALQAKRNELTELTLRKISYNIAMQKISKLPQIFTVDTKPILTKAAMLQHLTSSSNIVLHFQDGEINVKITIL
jgi:exodeoxyribonuclease VII large subunit